MQDEDEESSAVFDHTTGILRGPLWKQKRTAGDIKWRYRIVELETNSGMVTLYTPLKKVESSSRMLTGRKDDSGDDADDELGRQSERLEGSTFKAKTTLFINAHTVVNTMAVNHPDHPYGIAMRFSAESTGNRSKTSIHKESTVLVLSTEESATREEWSAAFKQIIDDKLETLERYQKFHLHKHRRKIEEWIDLRESEPRPTAQRLQQLTSVAHLFLQWKAQIPKRPSPSSKARTTRRGSMFAGPPAPHPTSSATKTTPDKMSQDEWIQMLEDDSKKKGNPSKTQTSGIKHGPFDHPERYKDEIQYKSVAQMRKAHAESQRGAGAGREEGQGATPEGHGSDKHTPQANGSEAGDASSEEATGTALPRIASSSCAPTEPAPGEQEGDGSGKKKKRPMRPLPPRKLQWQENLKSPQPEVSMRERELSREEELAAALRLRRQTARELQNYFSRFPATGQFLRAARIEVSPEILDVIQHTKERLAAEMQREGRLKGRKEAEMLGDVPWMSNDWAESSHQ